MGIKDLLRFMKPYIKPIHIKKYAGKRVGIDAYSWLHKGGNCSSIFNNFCCNFGMFCFSMKRQANRDLAMEKLKEGNVNAATEHFQKAINITPAMAHQLIQILRSENIEFVAAPYEADAQLAYLSSLEVGKGGIVAVITEDSDLIVYGSQATVFKMDRYGNGKELLLDKVFDSLTGTPSFRSFDKELFIGMCVLAGCDFLPSVPGIGIAKAYSMVSKYRNIDHVLSVLKFEKGSQMPEDYPKSFREAVAVFQHARVYDAGIKKIKHLKPLRRQLLQSLNEELDFLGPEIPPSVATAIAEGRLDPKLVFPLEIDETVKKTTVPKETQSKVPDNNPFKKRKLGEICLGRIKSTSEEVLVVDEDEKSDLLCVNPDIILPEVLKNSHSRKRKLNGSQLDQGESISNQVSVVIETEDSKSEKAMESQESVNSKPKRVSKGKERKTIEKKKTNTAPYSYWSATTFGTGDKVTLNLDVDGNLYLLNATSFKLQNLTSGVYKTRGTIFMMRIDSDGLFRLYSHSLGNSSRWLIVWNSTGDRCEPKGLCGLNSFCISNDLTPVCRCLPGFASVNQDNRTSGCERNFTAESCKSKGKKYTVEELENTKWEDVSYSVLSQTSKEDCSQACLVDCNCEAALFKDGECKKQRLPLRYGRRAGDSNNIALIKVEETSESSTDGILPTREGKKEISTNIVIIISCLFVALILVIVAIFGIILHRYHVLSVLKFEKGSQMPEDYPKSFREAVAVFQHARVEIPPSVATAIAEGRLDPVSMEAFNCFPSSGYHQDPVAIQTSSRPQKPEITIVSREEIEIDETVKKTRVPKETQLKVPDNNPFKKRKLGEICLGSIKSTSEEILVVDEDEKSDLLCVNPDIILPEVFKNSRSRKRKLNGSQLDQGESISNQVSVVIETEDSKSEKALESQESVNSKPKRVSKGKERKTIEKKKTSNCKNSVNKNTSILNLFSLV
ncbi:hypothetical protein EZV62_023355 [Acer yangbiense]|uniref:Exonuclease 1 n=1 Tax=Acer yangbiense TaxID=1000413 RepID=A0A5C7H1U9_9ROSI|nr:hypothetical protein EZV62_023355 [Acer yangbiense]